MKTLLETQIFNTKTKINKLIELGYEKDELCQMYKEDLKQFERELNEINN
jgi:hypothetical protein